MNDQLIGVDPNTGGASLQAAASVQAPSTPLAQAVKAKDEANAHVASYGGNVEFEVAEDPKVVSQEEYEELVTEEPEPAPEPVQEPAPEPAPEPVYEQADPDPFG